MYIKKKKEEKLSHLAELFTVALLYLFPFDFLIFFNPEILILILILFLI
jgi:hypothetical protein